MIFNFKSTSDAKTLGGKTADEFAKSDHGHTADEVGALSKNGGDVKGNVTVSANDNSQRYLEVKNTTNDLALFANTNGDIGLHSRSRSKWHSFMDANGNNYFNGVASGNLPLTGGTIKGFLDLKRSNDNVVGYGRIYQDNYTEKNFGLALRDYADSENFVGVRICHADDKIYYRAKDKVEKEVLHTGNSAKVHIGTAAPSDTSALWVDISA